MNSKYFSLALSSLLLLAACGEKDEPYIAPEEVEISIDAHMADSLWALYAPSFQMADQEYIPQDTAEAYYEDYAENWLIGEETRDVEIIFKGNTATWKFLDDSKKTPKYVKITADGAHVTIVNDSVTQGEADGRARMNYILSGESEDASIRIYSNKKFMVSLNNANLSNNKGSVINAQKRFEKKRMFLNIEKGTNNYITDAANYTDTIAGEDDKAAIFSEGKMILMGNGQLTVSGQYSHAIAADDRIFIHNGVQLTIVDAVKDAIHSKDKIVITGGRIQAFAQKDAVQAEELTLQGGLLLAAGKRAVTSPVFNYTEGGFCLVGNESNIPTHGSCDSIPAKGYKIYVSQK